MHFLVNEVPLYAQQGGQEASTISSASLGVEASSNNEKEAQEVRNHLAKAMKAQSPGKPCHAAHPASANPEPLSTCKIQLRDQLEERLRKARPISSHRMYLLISFRKSTPPQNRQPIVYYY